MIFTGRMVYLTAVTLQEYSGKLSSELLRLGLMHFVDIRTIDPVFSDESALSVQNEETLVRQTVLTAGRKRIESILNVGGFPRPTVGENEIGTEVPVDKNELDRMADSFESRIDKIRENQRNLQQQINRLEDVHRHMSDTDGGRFLDTGGISRGGAFLHVHTGSARYIVQDLRDRHGLGDGLVVQVEAFLGWLVVVRGYQQAGICTGLHGTTGQNNSFTG